MMIRIVYKNKQGQERGSLVNIEHETQLNYDQLGYELGMIIKQGATDIKITN